MQLWETCPFNSTTDAPFCGCDTGSEYPVPNAECGPYQGDTSICTGPYVQGTCSEGHMPAISVTALNQLHLQIFLVAVFHGLCAVYVALGGFVRIKQWTRWQDGLLDQPEAEMHIESSAGEMPDVPQGTEATEQQQQQQLGAQAATEVKAEERDSEERENDVENGSQNGVASQKSGPGDDPAAYVVDTITNATKQAKKTWGRRRTFIVRRRDWLSEALVCLGKALLPNLVSRTEFEMMYAGYCKSHGISGPFDFVGECRQQLDFDMGSLVGFSLEMWLVWVLVVLLSGLASAFLGYLLLFGVVCLFFSNIVLVAMVRFACRGGRPNELETTRRWYKNPGLLAIPLRLEIFTCSLAFSTTIFFSWQFGANSCLFKEGVWPYVVGGLWWWTAIVISILMLSWTALVTIPAWTLCVHMSPKSTTQPILEGGEAPPEQNWTSEKLVHEIARLQTLQRRERNAMSFKRS